MNLELFGLKKEVVTPVRTLVNVTVSADGEVSTRFDAMISRLDQPFKDQISNFLMTINELLKNADGNKKS